MPMSMSPGRVRQIPARRYCEMGRSGQEIPRQAAIGTGRASRFYSRCQCSLSPQWRRDRDRRGSGYVAARRPARQLGMTGPHFGCGAGECGACNVIVGDHAVASPATPRCGRWRTRTSRPSKGLGKPEKPHPLQRAFIAEQALQCGYCVSGILMSAAALLMQNPNPSSTRGEGGARPQSLPLRLA